MNVNLIILEISVAVLGLVILLFDLWTPAPAKKMLGYLCAAGLVGILGLSISIPLAEGVSGMFTMDALALFFKQYFLLGAILTVVLALECSKRLEMGLPEYFALMMFALAGMMFAASATDFALMFVALETVTVTFYILVSYQRTRMQSLEAGVKYLILGALSTAFTVFGIALIFGTTNSTSFQAIADAAPLLTNKPLLLVGFLFVLAGLAFKLGVFPMQVWAPDVYQGAPVPTVAFLAAGSKGAGIVLLLRVLFMAFPLMIEQWGWVLMVISGVSILYGSLCAIPQRNLKRLIGYSSIANGGYMLMGMAALSQAGMGAVLFYLLGYMFAVMAALFVIAIVCGQAESDDVSALAGLSKRSPILASTMTIAMVSLAGIPPMAGFFGKFLLLKALIQHGGCASYTLVAVALFGVVVSMYYYFGVVRAIYWSKEATDLTPIRVGLLTRIALWVCILAILWIGTMPSGLVDQTRQAAAVLFLK